MMDAIGVFLSVTGRCRKSAWWSELSQRCCSVEPFKALFEGLNIACRVQSCSIGFRGFEYTIDFVLLTMLARPRPGALVFLGATVLTRLDRARPFVLSWTAVIGIVSICVTHVENQSGQSELLLSRMVAHKYC